jgi:ABC-type dipeptide/oligopeptide/nickel transport system permease subunit
VKLPTIIVVAKIWPAVALALAVFGFNMLDNGLRDLLDLWLKGG